MSRLTNCLAFGFAPGAVEILIVGLLCLLFLGVPATVLAVVLINRRRSPGNGDHYGRIHCPECGESIAAEAVKCRFCGLTLQGDDTAPDDSGAASAD